MIKQKIFEDQASKSWHRQRSAATVIDDAAFSHTIANGHAHISNADDELTNHQELPDMQSRI
ncbi:hypothetical protein ACTXT7_002084 [Hymenolepis weldensis]